MYGPPPDVREFYEAIPGSAPFDQENGLYTFNCSSIPSVSFSWGGKKWDITPEKLVNILMKTNFFLHLFSFNLGQTEAGSTRCVGAIAGQDLGLGSNVWLLGDRYVYNVIRCASSISYN